MALWLDWPFGWNHMLWLKFQVKKPMICWCAGDQGQPSKDINMVLWLCSQVLLPSGLVQGLEMKLNFALHQDWNYKF
jgi:hypothetical protein